MRTYEGVTFEVEEKMRAVDADAIAEDGKLFRRCECGVYHPVGDVHVGRVSDHDQQYRHYTHGELIPFSRSSPCCEAKCCEQWSSSGITAARPPSAR